MVTLQEKSVKFNQNIFVSHTGGDLSSDSGLMLVKEFMDALEFSELAEKKLQLPENRAYWQYENHTILEQLALQLIAGYAADSSANILRHDPVFQTILGKESLASQSSISRFLDRFTEKNILQLQELNQVLIDKARLIRNTNEMIFGLDSTHSDTLGDQEQTDYNAHYQTYGYHPLVAFNGMTGDFLKAELRSGNQYTSKGVKEFMTPLFEHYEKVVPVTNILVRGDSGFATPELYELCEEHKSHYVIRMKNNRRLVQLAEQYVRIGDNHPWEKTEVHYHSISYQAQKWTQARRVCVRSTREGGELLFSHEFVVTTLSEDTSSEMVFKTYAKRGTMENFIKEAKNGFFFDKTDSPHFIENHARMMFSVLAYNLVNFLRTSCFQQEWTGLQINTIRLRLLKVAGKLVRTGRSIYLKLSSHHVFQKEFYQAFHRIREIRCWI